MSSCPSSTERPRALRWGLIGASDIAARRVLPALREAGQQICGVYSSDERHGVAFAATHGIPGVLSTPEELCSGPIDAVYVSSRNHLHRCHVEVAAAAGKHVLCEKPLALSVADAQAMVAACSAAGIVLATNHHERNGAPVRAMARLVAQGAIGRPLAARLQHAVLLPERLRGWRLQAAEGDGGVILDITCHDVDTLRFVLGREVREVMAIAARQGLAAEGVEDAAMTLMRFDDGVLATTYDAFTTPCAGTALEVHGTEGSLFGTDVLTQDPIGEVMLRRDGSRTMVEVGERQDLYVRGVLDFLAAVAGAPSSIATGEDGLRAVAVAVAALESARGAIRGVSPARGSAQRARDADQNGIAAIDNPGQRP